MQSTLRDATEDDIPHICDIERASMSRFLTVPALADLVASDKLSADKARDWITSGRVVLVSQQSRPDFPQSEGGVKGFVSIQTVDSKVYIAEIAVAGDSQGQGLGAKLLRAVFAHATELAVQQNRQTAEVTLTTYAELSWNGPWYRKHGFTEVQAADLGPEHVAKRTLDAEERGLERPGYRRICMLWTAAVSHKN